MAHNFGIAGQNIEFFTYQTDLVQLYLDRYYPHCSRCLFPGTTTANCISCKQRDEGIKNQTRSRAKGQGKKAKEINRLTGKARAAARCVRCSRQDGHVYLNCDSKPCCFLDKLSHSVVIEDVNFTDQSELD